MFGQFAVQTRLHATLFKGIWLCHDLQQDGQLVVVKQVRLDFARQALARQLQLDNPWEESHILDALRELGPHENIVQAQQQFEQEDCWYAVMEYCGGGDLWGTLEREPRNRLPEVQALPLFKQIFQGVRFLHTNGIAHRDLSLENVLLSHNNNGGGAGAFGTPKICDFGLSTDSDQTCRERVGKNYYMAPEVVAGDAYNPRAADMWSLGIILFVMLTGSPLTPLASEKEEAFVALKEFGIERIVETWHMSDLVSRATMDLLVGLLQIDPFARFTAEDVVVHRALMDL